MNIVISSMYNSCVASGLLSNVVQLRVVELFLVISCHESSIVNKFLVLLMVNNYRYCYSGYEYCYK